jgi:hypothetical protein
MSVLKMSQIAVQAHAARQQAPQAGAEAPDAPRIEGLAHPVYARSALATYLSTEFVSAPRARAGLGGTVADALSAIETYIPTEVVTVYAAVTAAIDSSAARTHTGQWVAFWLFLALTPVANWCLYAAMLRGRQEPVPWRPQRDWPWYGMVTAAVAFALWGFTLPGTPFAGFSWYNGAIGAPVLLVGSLVLGLAGSVFGPAGGTGQPAA